MDKDYSQTNQPTKKTLRQTELQRLRDQTRCQQEPGTSLTAQKRFRSAVSLGKDKLQLLSCLEAIKCVLDPQLLLAVIHIGVGFGDAVVFKSSVPMNHASPI